MKFLLSLLLVTIFNTVIAIADHNVPIDLVTSGISQQLAEYLKYVKDVELPFPIPIEDTYGFDQVELSLPGDIFSANINISKGSITGVSGFRLLELKIFETEPSILFNVLFPSLTLHAENYVLDGNILNAVPIKGHGKAHFEITNLQISGTLFLKQSLISHAVLLDKLENGELRVDRIVSRTEFDQNIDAIISALIEDLLADYVNRFNKYIIATYSGTAIQYINKIIEAK